MTILYVILQILTTKFVKNLGTLEFSKVKYLEYAFYRYKGKCRFRVHPKSVEKKKDRIKELTKRDNGWGNEYRAMDMYQHAEWKRVLWCIFRIADCI